ncbi:hypothetical protein AX17_005769 [Amanita inopinata Kibby_2008]|nr:hypothetical protein AX17_005769 [Amanita inopinata Kibby_2008]
MDVPFSSSGALSRRHYALVRKVESATSIREADRHLLAEIESVRLQLMNPGLSLAQSTEHMIILLYCFDMIAADFSPGLLAFALPHAISLAETGKTIEAKRIGYHFCVVLMRPDDELQLMLINTLRKDLESDNVPRICLALENLIAAPNEIIIPAIQSRLQGLLTHNSAHVRRRAIYAYRSLSKYDRNLLSPISLMLLKSMDDPDYSVVSAAISMVPSNIFQEMNGMKQFPKFQATVNRLLFEDNDKIHPLASNALTALFAVKAHTEDMILPFCNLVRISSLGRNLSVLFSIFQLFSRYSRQQLEKNLEISPVSYIRDLLASNEPNFQYLFLACLNYLDIVFWASITPNYSNVLDGQEVERIMCLLDSPDSLIRKKTLSLLMRVDPNVIDAIYTRSLQSITAGIDARKRDEGIIRLLEVLDEKSADDGEIYAQYIKDLFADLGGTFPVTFVSEVGVEKVLSHIQYSTQSFQIQCIATLLMFLSESQPHLGPTMLVIGSALATQYCKLVSIPPAEVLSSLASSLPSASPPVQDAILLAMLRLAAECEVPENVHANVAEIYETGGRHIKQAPLWPIPIFVPTEKHIADDCKAIPHFEYFLLSLEAYAATIPSPSQPENIYVVPMSSGNPFGNKLRYEAYDTPRSTPKLRASKLLTSRTHTEDAVDLSANKRHPVLGTSKTSNAPPFTVNELSSRMDLIAFDQPLASPSGLHEDVSTDFLKVWNTTEGARFGMRGWSNAQVGEIVQKLQDLNVYDLTVIPAHQDPFIGETKIKIMTRLADGIGHAVLKLRASEEDGTLWRLCTEEEEMGRRVGAVLREE